MPRPGHSAEEIAAKLALADELLRQGQTIVAVAQALGVTRMTYYRWRQEQQGAKADLAQRLRALERENAELRRLLADRSPTAA